MILRIVHSLEVWPCEVFVTMREGGICLEKCHRQGDNNLQDLRIREMSTCVPAYIASHKPAVAAVLRRNYNIIMRVYIYRTSRRSLSEFAIS